jgi:addiction module HigA family antidote
MFRMPMKNPAHPGLIVRDLIEEAGLTVVEAAARLKVSRQQLTRLLGEKSGVSPEMALRLEAVFGSTAEAWLRMQDAWELARLRPRAGDITAGLKRVEPA